MSRISSPKWLSHFGGRGKKGGHLLILSVAVRQGILKGGMEHIVCFLWITKIKEKTQNDAGSDAGHNTLAHFHPYVFAKTRHTTATHMHPRWQAGMHTPMHARTRVHACTIKNIN